MADNNDQSGDQPKYKVNDRRHWMQEEGELEAAAPEDSVPTYVKQLRAEAEDKDKRLREYIAAYKAKTAEIEDVKQRLQRENEGRLDQFKAKFIAEFFPVVDNLSRASASAEANGDLPGLLQGIRMIIGQLARQLQDNGVERIQSVGRAFNPATDEACMVVPTNDSAQDNIIVEELEPGYTFGGKLLKPVKVKVARKS